MNNSIFQSLIVKYYNFVLRMNQVLKFNQLIQYRNNKRLNYCVDMVGCAKPLKIEKYLII